MADTATTTTSVQAQRQPHVRDLFNLDGQVAVVTGASKGIGEAIAWALAQCGARVVVSSRKQDAVDGVAAEMRAAGLEATGIAANVGRMDEARGLIDRVVETYGDLHILVNNAVTNPVFGAVDDVDEGAFNKIMDTNVKGPFELSKRAHAAMRTYGHGGAVVNISSIGGISPEFGLGIYSVSKAALISLTKVMAREWGGDAVRVNVICPGLIKTKFSAALWGNDDILTHVMSRQPLQHVGTPEEVASLALFLASPAGGFCTGGVYTVDGGYTI